MGTHYLIEKKIGRGGTSNVYMAMDNRTRKMVAAKLLVDDIPPEYLKKDFESSPAVSHPNIVKLIEKGHEGDKPFIILELIDGPNLRQVIDNYGPIPWNLAKPMILRVVQALAAFHSAGVVYRSLTPNKIRIEDHRVVLVHSCRSVTMKNIKDNFFPTGGRVNIGKPEYMDVAYPENFASIENDIYSTGIVLYEMLTGKVPIQGRTPMETVELHKTFVPENPSAKVAGIPPALDFAVMTALQKRWYDRFQSMVEFERVLKAIEPVKDIN